MASTPIAEDWSLSPIRSSRRREFLTLLDAKQQKRQKSSARNRIHAEQQYDAVVKRIVATPTWHGVGPLVYNTSIYRILPASSPRATSVATTVIYLDPAKLPTMDAEMKKDWLRQ
jgi:hypothetical protein